MLAYSKRFSLILLFPTYNSSDRVDHRLLRACMWHVHHFFCQTPKAVGFAILADYDQRRDCSEPLQFTSNVFSQMRRDRATNHDGVKVLFLGQIQHHRCFLCCNYVITGVLDSGIAEPKAGDFVAD